MLGKVSSGGWLFFGKNRHGGGLVDPEKTGSRRPTGQAVVPVVLGRNPDATFFTIESVFHSTVVNHDSVVCLFFGTF